MQKTRRFFIFVLPLLFLASTIPHIAHADNSTSTLGVQSQDSYGNMITGYYNVIYDNNGTRIGSGWTPINYLLNNNQNYSLQIGSFGKSVFNHWMDTNSQSATRLVNISQNTTLTAIYKTIPQPPTNVNAQPTTSSEIDITWSLPAQDGGSSIMGYMIQHSTDNGETWTTIGNTQNQWFHDTGLSAATKYTYQVMAINDVGNSDPSQPVSATTYLFSTPPVNIPTQNIPSPAPSPTPIPPINDTAYIYPVWR